MSRLFLEVLIGIAIQMAGAELLLRATASFAKHRGAGIAAASLWMLGFGLCSPMLYTTFEAASAGSPDLAVGTIIGGLMVKLLVVLGICASVTTLSAQSQIRSSWVLVAAAIFFAFFAHDGEFARWEGLLMLAALAAYILHIYQQGDRAADFSIITKTTDCAWCAAAYLCVGFGLVTTGSDILIDGAVWFAKHYAVSETITGATLVALATSIPLGIASLVAIERKQPQLVFPLLIGASYFHLLGGAGLAASFTALPIPIRSLADDLGIMVAATLLVAILVKAKKSLTSQEGALLIALASAYGVYSFGL
jgi:cation:H+ antiporter